MGNKHSSGGLSLEEAQEKLSDFEALNLEHKVKRAKEIFTACCFDEYDYPEIHGAIEKVGKASLDVDIKKIMKALKNKALENRLIEDVRFLDPHKTADAKYTTDIITLFSDVLKVIYAQAIEKYAAKFSEKWLHIARHRAEKGHLYSDVEEAMSNAMKYAEFVNKLIPAETLEVFYPVHKSRMAEFGRHNINVLRQYAARILYSGASEERYNKLMKYAEKLANEAGEDIFHQRSFLSDEVKEEKAFIKRMKEEGKK